MQISRETAQRVEKVSGVIGMIGVVALVACVALSFYLKLGNLGDALKHKITAAALGTAVGTVTTLALAVLLWKVKTVAETSASHA